MTLVFTLSAARSLADPAAAFADARRWSAHVGIVANDAGAVEAFCERHDLENDYALRDWDKWGTLADVREATDTPRHVFVGTGPEDRRLADTVGLEFRSVDEAAGKAGWPLGDPDSSAREADAGLVARLRRTVTDGPWWPF
ncbi:DUF7124 domain-containing protein [Halorubrum halodurans]|uniref:DUF7124 domain-containing protein n=1 Tax=Halorubrum halodurans TaxID=1383851 RepID=A0A256IFP8_9EURY|nr:hypothetical protein [Halorubrum halodurans]OYR55375.1 hypothetical protein DJ70_11995 [Halorubrum halodurans]